MNKLENFIMNTYNKYDLKELSIEEALHTLTLLIFLSGPISNYYINNNASYLINKESKYEISNDENLKYEDEIETFEFNNVKILKK